MNDFTEFVGKTTEEALQRAQEHWQLPLNRLEVEVVSTGSSGIFGLLAKKARVRVRPLAGSSSREEDMAALAAMVSDGHASVAKRDPGLQPPAEPPKATPRPRAPQAPLPAAPIAAPVTPSAVPSAAPPPATSVDQAPPSLVAATTSSAPSAPQAAAPSVAVPFFQPQDEDQDLADTVLAETALADDSDEEDGEGDQRLEQEPQVVEDAREVLARMVTPLEESAQVRAQGGPHGIELVIDSQDVGVLIGRRGQNLEALQYLVTRIVSHKYGRPVRILVDAGDYRRRRNEALEELALRMALKSRQSGRPVAIGPLSAQERRVVHLVLKKEEGLVTNSRGRGELKKVVISPKA